MPKNWSFYSQGGEGDGLWHEYTLFEWQVRMSIGHGYRPNHLPREVFAPDLTRDGTMDNFADAILEDISEMYLADALPAHGTNGERSVNVGGSSITYRYRVDPSENRFYIGTFFVNLG
ncbi:hypothetical protein HPC49_18315 [Pyxidicoccus fallax]|uniref:Uncharacterized protein n=1 Tax=Pyxidicoccus fallax TaxID=394095 RepID=A0A848LIQ0_9BACT|nr:hypothetical protein [Pyxidicoccus fallax]NMO17605.1 hypothetical protein [Pyxidicoccus fallax]NPC80165.1 hypothetical protein [Pyxidicoccus fallax]